MTTKMRSSANPAMTVLRSGRLQRKCACGGTPGPTGECQECRKKRLQRQIGNRQSTVEDEKPVPSIVHDVIRSGGEPLDPISQAFMESRFAYDFGHLPTPHVVSRASARSSADSKRRRLYGRSTSRV